MNNDKLQNFEKFLMFCYVLKEGCEDEADQRRKFRKITGMSEADLQMAIDECVLRGFIDKE